MIDLPTALLVGLLVAAAAAVGAALARAWVDHHRRRWLDDVTWRRVIVHTRDGQSIDGHLAQVLDDGLRLTGAKLISEDPAKSLAGDVHVHRDRVAWIQTHPAG